VTDYAEALRLIRQCMQPGDTVGKMFLRAAKALEGCRTPFASTLTGDEAIERLRQINRLTYSVTSNLPPHQRE
jgi:hypothetical protein